MSSDWETKIKQQHGNNLQELARLNPSWTKRTAAFFGLFKYAGDLVNEDKKKGEALRRAFEVYMDQLQKTHYTLSRYSDEQKKESKLWKEVDLGFRACEAWMAAVEKKKAPKDIENSLPRKTTRLHNYIAIETVEQLSEVQNQLNQLVEDAKARGLLTHPLIYYTKGKEHIEKMEWLEAKDAFRTYEKFVEEKSPLCRPPAHDNYLTYLSYIHEQIAAQSKENPDPIVSIVEVRNNPYEAKAKAWKERYQQDDALLSLAPRRALSASSSSSSSTTSSTTTTTLPTTDTTTTTTSTSTTTITITK